MWFSSLRCPSRFSRQVPIEVAQIVAPKPAPVSMPHHPPRPASRFRAQSSRPAPLPPLSRPAGTPRVGQSPRLGRLPILEFISATATHEVPS
ncbi:hypothetical protein H6P81_013240 [Aristolochia fimbriata]|uniref:Uncharacterized protein n=1 Tax=Aristolochia fimbriata TaxID=158543 RepID=A0AAV7EE60_ARIFI|nr:hypothetical protein H6P81_013240 [Aristolochia fimbriata]